MSESALKTAYEKALQLPEAEQAIAADVLEDFLDQHASGLRLSEGQLAEVRRRVADPEPSYASDEEVEAFFRRGLNGD